MEIIKNYLPINGFSRTGKKRAETLIIAIHNVGKDWQSAKNVQGYFASLATQDAMDNKPDVSASAQFVIDLDGTTYQLMDMDEKAYHLGSSINDPKSGKIYTDLARALLGKYASNPETLSPNSAAIGIELCHKTGGEITKETLASCVELCKMLCKKYSLDPLTRIVTHQQIVGWKPCPLVWTGNPSLITEFKNRVASELVG